jgi:hypothetical protein
MYCSQSCGGTEPSVVPDGMLGSMVGSLVTEMVKHRAADKIQVC